jgi:hypothetical protein
MREATVARYESGEKFGFADNHPRLTKNLHRFTPKERSKSHAVAKTNGTQGGNGTKRPYQTGPGHHNWKGGYQNRLWLARRRGAMRKGATGSHTREQWEELKALYHNTCASCLKAEPEIVLTEVTSSPSRKMGAMTFRTSSHSAVPATPENTIAASSL